MHRRKLIVFSTASVRWQPPFASIAVYGQSSPLDLSPHRIHDRRLHKLRLSHKNLVFQLRSSIYNPILVSGIFGAFSLLTIVNGSMFRSEYCSQIPGSQMVRYLLISPWADVLSHAGALTQFLPGFIIQDDSF